MATERPKTERPATLPSDLCGSYRWTISHIRAVELPTVRAKVRGLERLRDDLIKQGAEDSKLTPVHDALTQANENVADAVGQIEAFTEEVAEHCSGGGLQRLAPLQPHLIQLCEQYQSVFEHIRDVELPAAEAKVTKLEQLRDDLIEQGVEESQLAPVLDALARANAAVNASKNELEAFREEIAEHCS
ncbi:hypothetical protein ACFYNZ_33890 [Streptomyces kebangsaanensis]|uniref:Uncharacterized protein n=1 Tax=Streptomyces kebangsaanensis TaxID=864058 RepID=A0ABW6L2Q4_9ACTN